MTRGRHVAPLALTLALLAGTAAAQERVPQPSEEMPPAATPTQPAEEQVSRDENAVQTLIAAQEALQGLKTVTLSAHSEIVAESGPLAAFKLGADGAVWARKDEDGKWTRSMVGNADEIGASDQLAFTIIKDDQNASWIDTEKQEVVHAIGRFAKGRVYGCAELMGIEFFLSGKPYAAELGAQKLEYLGTENVDGTLCDVVRAEYGGRSLTKRWYFSTGDKFPRRITEELMEGAERIYDFTQVQLDTEIDPSRFELDAPSSYLVVNMPQRRNAVNAPVGAEPVVSGPDDEPGKTYGSEVGDLGTPFTAEDIFGTAYNSEDYTGKPLVLFFWASWLPNTPATLDDIFKIHDHLGDNGSLLTLALRERQPENASNIMLDAEGREDIVVITSGGRVGGAYNIARVPVVVVLDAEGRIVYRNDDYHPGETVSEVIEAIDKLEG